MTLRSLYLGLKIFTTLLLVLVCHVKVYPQYQFPGHSILQDETPAFDQETYFQTGPVEFQWSSHFGMPDRRSYDAFVDMEVDSMGNSYILGRGTVSPPGFAFKILKYSSTGNLEWSKSFDGYIRNKLFPFAYATDLDIDSEGNVFATGLIKDESKPKGYVYAIVKYNTDGEEQWFAIPEHFPLKFLYSNPVIKVDNDGNIILGAHTTGFGSGRDFMIYKYSTDGEVI